MTLSLFRIQNDLIADTSPEGWYRLREIGPSYRYRWGFGPEYHEIVDDHREQAVNRQEPSLTVAWGMAIDSRGDRSSFAWAEGQFVDPEVRTFFVDFFWAGSLIDRVALARVDGTHGVIPLPHPAGGGYAVTNYEAAVAYLIHGLEEGETYDHPGRYLESLGIKRVPDDHREGAGQ